MRIEGNFERFFAHFPQYQQHIMDNLQNAKNFIQTHPHKIKTVKGYKYLHKSIYEYKIRLDSRLDCRVAYVFLENEIVFFYISTNILKAVFTKEVSKIQGVSKS